MEQALGNAATVLNVGAGTGSYEPANRYTIAVEPSATMRAQRQRAGKIPAVIGRADALPFDDQSFEAAMAILTVHHWPDMHQGLQEVKRVTRGPVVVMTFDPDSLDKFWNARYFPQVIESERRRYPTIGFLDQALGGRCDNTSTISGGTWTRGNGTANTATTAPNSPSPADCALSFVDANLSLVDFGRRVDLKIPILDHMKKLLLLLLLPMAAHAQQMNVDTVNYTYTGIESADGVPAHILQSRARLFVADYINTIKAETKVDDPDGGDLLVNDFLHLAIKMPGDKDSSILGQLNFTFKLVVKDGKYKFSCYGVNHQQDNNVLGGGWLTNIKPACGTFAMSMEKWRQVRASGNNYVLAFIAALKAAMKSDEVNPLKPDF